MSARHALIFVAVLAATMLSAQRIEQSDGAPMTPVECGLQYRSCLCRFVEYHGWQCTGFTARPASEEPPKFPDVERSRPIPPDPADIIPIQ